MYNEIDGKSLDVTTEKINRLRELFPEVFAEDKIDFKRLRDVLGDNVVIQNEHYELSWAGKSAARREVQKQTTATLIPDKEGSINFDNTENIFIEGENLEVLRVLQKSYFGKVKMIYIDPPYNTGNDSFVYPDDYTERADEYKKRTGQTDEEGYLNKQDLWRQNSRENGQFHSVWLSMMYPRLYLARNLLREDGVIFISIDDNEIHNLRAILNEIFGEENFVAELIWNLKSGTQAGHFTRSHEYVLCFAKNLNSLSYFVDKQGGLIKHGALKIISKDNPASEITFPKGMAFEGENAVFEGEIGGSEKQIIHGKMIFKNGKLQEDVTITAGWGMRNQILSWLDGKETLDSKGQKVTRLYFNSSGILWYEKERGTVHPKTVLDEIVGNTKNGSEAVIELFGSKIFNFPKPPNLVRYLANNICSIHNGDVIMDFFAGSGTTAQAVIELNEADSGNRKFLCIQMPEKLFEESEAAKAGYKTIAEITKTRIQKVINKVKEERESKLDLEKAQPLGFQSYTLAPSNFNQWRGDVEGAEIIKQLELHQRAEKQESPQINMLYELLLKGGKPLTAKVEEIEVAEGCTVYNVDKGNVWMLFDKYTPQVKEKVTEAKPQQLVCLNSCFATDQDLSNLKLELNEAGIKLTIV